MAVLANKTHIHKQPKKEKCVQALSTQNNMYIYMYRYTHIYMYINIYTHALHTQTQVGDVHRTMCYGGIFMYPADKRAQVCLVT